MKRKRLEKGGDVSGVAFIKSVGLDWRFWIVYTLDGVCAFSS